MTERSDLFLLRDLPRYDSIAALAEGYPELEPRSAQAYLTLLRVASEMLGWRQRFMAERGLTQPQFTALMLLSCPDHGPSTPSELADRCGVTRATMTGVLDALEREGLVERTPDPSDRRMLRVSVTSQGEVRLDTILPEYFASVRTLMAPLTGEERDVLTGLLSKIGLGMARETSSCAAAAVGTEGDA